MNEPARLQAIDQLDRAVMLDLQAFRQRPDGCTLPAAQALYRQERLMLLRLQTSGTRRLLAEVQETPDLVAKFPQRLNVTSGMFTLFHSRYNYIVLRCK